MKSGDLKTGHHGAVDTKGNRSFLCGVGTFLCSAPGEELPMLSSSHPFSRAVLCGN